uniref:C-type lectin domain-containing protein n=1 Tax=Neogobius melanostomus TaxID=47308 RepID=A0A8C6SES6_9GOBI
VDQFLALSSFCVLSDLEYHIIHLEKTWFEAQQYCRQHYTDLARLGTWTTSTVSKGPWTWIGLYRQAWRWSDGSDSQFKNWRSGQPDGGNEHCAWEHGHKWDDAPCSFKRKFVCHRGDSAVFNILSQPFSFV